MAVKKKQYIKAFEEFDLLNIENNINCFLEQGHRCISVSISSCCTPSGQLKYIAVLLYEK